MPIGCARASGRRDHRPGLDGCLKALQPGSQRRRESLRMASTEETEKPGMRIDARDAKSGKSFSGEAGNLDQSVIKEFFNSLDMSKEAIDRSIDRLDISADAKRCLSRVVGMTIRAGEFVIRVGRKIIEVIGFLIRTFPKASSGLIIGAVIGSLAASVPVLGFMLGPIIGPLAMALGLALGVREDILDMNMRRTVQEATVEFERLRTA